MARADAIRHRIRKAMLADQGRLKRRLRELDRRVPTAGKGDNLDSIERDLAASIARRAERAEKRPTPRYAGDLPIHAHVDEIRTMLERERVLIVCGETGSGKTTQLPKICLDAGRGVAGLIGHTQPRRIAARSVAKRIADELGTPLGEKVGYQVRFVDETSDASYVKVMTDGILLAEIPRDRMLRRYDTLIIDEAHERSLNIDFLLGYVKTLVERRSDLRLIITSATINPGQFSAHFNDAPIISVEGRTYPVEMRYRSLRADTPGEPGRDVVTGILDAVDEVTSEGPGDVLVFLPGERDIKDTARALRGRVRDGTEILPLYSRLSLEKQSKVFQSHPGRRIVLATNVAETSITVPGIRYVIDPGDARVSRYSARARVQRLPIEPVSQASANQRAGRCGRVQDGICIRLYNESDFEKREPFTQPEIQRSSLAGVILRMLALGLGDIETFPFLDPPRQAMVAEGFDTLRELGALNDSLKLTNLGRKLARLPMDPRLGRMMLEAERRDALREILIIVSGLSIQDPRERPAEFAQAADRAHEEFRDEQSDFLTLVKIWDWYHERVREGPWSAVKRACRDHFLSFIRMREWQDLHRQLVGLSRGMKTEINAESAPYESIHRCILTGLLSQIGQRDRRERGKYIGANHSEFHVFPASSSFQTPPRWAVCTEVIETKKRYAHYIARVRTNWIEEAADHLVKRTYSEPGWDRQHGWVTAKERVTLFGLPIVEDRVIPYGPIAPEEARTVFIQRALVEEEIRPIPEFIEHNRALIRDIEVMEAKARRRNLLVDERVRWAYYDARLPEEMYTSRQLESWLRTTQKRDPEILRMTREQLLEQAHALPSRDAFPDHLDVGPTTLRLTYHLEPGADDDGVTLHVPVEMINQLIREPLEWLVPGMIEDKVVGLLRTLPKSIRKNFVPAPDYARDVTSWMTFREGSLLDQLSHYLSEMTGVTVRPEDFDPTRLDNHLRMNLRVIDADESIVHEGRDLATVRLACAQSAMPEQARATVELEADDLTSWSVDPIPHVIERMRAGAAVKGFPALVDRGNSVAVRVLDTEESAAVSHRAGVCRLAAIVLGSEVRSMLDHLPGID
ncbi:MAG: ATP-dependent RNA helicase HrpA, partial [Planctomycetota bacterium]